MRRITPLLLLVGSLLSISPIVLSQQSAILTGRTTDHRLQKLSVSWWQDGSFTPSTMSIAEGSDSFYFKIPVTAGKPLFYYLEGKSIQPVFGLVEAGDSLYIKQLPDSLLITGKGAAASRIMSTIQRLQDGIIPNGTDVESMKRAYSEQIKVAASVLQQNKSSINETVYKLLEAHTMSGPATRLTGMIWKLPLNPDSTLEERQVDFYRRDILPALPATELSEITVMSTRFVNYLLQKSEVDFYIKHRFESNTTAVYDWVKQRYAGKVRDRLLAQTLIQGYASGNMPEEQEACVKDYLSIAVDSGCKQAVARLYGRTKKGLSRGAVAPLFNLPDASGKLVSLPQFLGKVVLLHFYDSDTIGSGELVALKKCFDDKEVSFLNIGNPAMEAGLPGMQLLLNDASKAILSQYEINRYPSFIVIGKDGKIFATKPPNPLSDHGTALANIIYDALLQ
jgi:hypothetical protein